MAELRVVAHRCVDIYDAAFTDEGVAADHDRPDVNVIRLRAIAENDAVFP